MKTIIFFLTLTTFLLGSTIKGLSQSKLNPKVLETPINNRSMNNNQNYQRDQNMSNSSQSPIVTPVSQYPKEQDSIRQFKEETSNKISKLDKDIAGLKVKIAKGTEATKDEYQKALADMEDQSQQLKLKLDRFKYRENVKWHDFKNDMDRDLDKLGNSISDFSKKIMK
jgi:hypothetical protein